jgi:hypothetical protein
MDPEALAAVVVNELARANPEWDARTVMAEAIMSLARALVAVILRSTGTRENRRMAFNMTVDDMRAAIERLP